MPRTSVCMQIDSFKQRESHPHMRDLMKHKLNRSSGLSASRSQNVCTLDKNRLAPMSSTRASTGSSKKLIESSHMAISPASGAAISRLQYTVCLAEQITLLLVRDCASH